MTSAHILLAMIRERWLNSPIHFFYYFISPTLFFADYRKHLAHSRGQSVAQCFKNLNFGFFIVSAVLTLALLFTEWAFRQEVTYFAWQLLIVTFSIYAFSRCNEIFIAFIRDATHHLQPRESFSGLKYYERIHLALRSYLELILDYALVYRGVTEVLCGGFSASLSSISAVYFSGVTIMTIGYGDIHPTHWLPRLLSVYEALNGIALIVVSFTVYVSRSMEKKEFQSMEPFNLRRWRRRASPESAPSFFFTCARPGRSYGNKDNVSDTIVDEWVAGLPEATETAIVSLLGRKPDGGSEFSFYTFYGKCDTPEERGCRPSFQEWLDQRHPTRAVEVFEYPTDDFKPVPTETLAAAAADIERLLSTGLTVVLIDSSGETRTKAVCKHIGFVEDTRMK